MNKKKRILFLGEASFLHTGFAIYTKEILTRLHATGKFEIAELGVYGHMTDERRFSIPWTYYGNAPDTDKDEQEYLRNPLNQFGAWKFEEVCLDFKPDIVCIPPGELILTDSGYKAIEEVKINDKVMTHKGEFRSVVKTMRHQINEKLYHVYFNGCKTPIKLTGKHPILIFKKRNQTNKCKSWNTIYDGLQPEFVAAKDVKVGDLIATPIPKTNCCKNIVIDVSKFLTNFICENNKLKPIHDTNTNEINQYIEINYDFATLFGYILADGHIGDRSVRITFTGDEEIFANDAQRLWKKCFGIDSTISYEKDKYCINININSVLICDFFKKWSNKNIPMEIWVATKDTIKGLIRGLVRGDGCYKKNTVSFCNLNTKLLNAYRMLCTLLEIPTTISKIDVNGYGVSSQILHDIVEKQEFNNDIIHDENKSVQIINGYLVSSIRRIRTTDYEGQVYNLEVEEHNSYIVHQACVHNCDPRDWWMGEYVYRSPFRNMYKWAIMPTIDSTPQLEEWVETYMDADAVFAYSEFGRDYLLEATNGRINFRELAPPAADYDIFTPVPNKDAHRSSMGFVDNLYIIGTIMRNQKRKLYPDLISSFAKFVSENPSIDGRDVYLYLHCSYPDQGWDIPRLIREAGIGNRVLFTYVCRNSGCNHVFTSFFSDALQTCPKCGYPTAGLPNITNGVSKEALAKIINLFDLYVQYSICEGFGMPQVEAAACGVPVVAVDYSAMQSVVNNLGGGYLVPVQRMFTECESHSNRAYPDNAKLIEIMEKFLRASSQVKFDKSRKCFINSRKFYDWDRSAKAWEKYMDEVTTDNDLWNQPPRIHQPVSTIPNGLNNEQFVRWAIANVWGHQDKVESYLALRLIRDLNYGKSVGGTGGSYFHEDNSLFGRPNFSEFGREQVLQQLLNLNRINNYWEQRRVGLIREGKRPFIHLAKKE